MKDGRGMGDGDGLRMGWGMGWVGRCRVKGLKTLFEVGGGVFLIYPLFFSFRDIIIIDHYSLSRNFVLALALALFLFCLILFCSDLFCFFVQTQR